MIGEIQSIGKFFKTIQVGQYQSSNKEWKARGQLTTVFGHLYYYMDLVYKMLSEKGLNTYVLCDAECFYVRLQLFSDAFSVGHIIRTYVFGVLFIGSFIYIYSYSVSYIEGKCMFL